MGHPLASAQRALGLLVTAGSALLAACSGTSSVAAPEHAETARPDAPIVEAQPGAWFDAYGNLTVVGPGRRLRLVLSAPIAACGHAFQTPGSPADVALRASVPFHVLSDACREAHPTILLAEESKTASPSELEHSYHDVAHCAGTDWGLTEGWVPRAVEGSDPCPLALGLGWRLPNAQELQGLTVDDRKAIAGALFDTQEASSFGSLLLYARGASGELGLVTLSPNAAEQAPSLTDDKRERPFFGAALRCVREDGGLPNTRVPLPVLPEATSCLQEQRKSQSVSAGRALAPLPAELQQLKDWLATAERASAHVRDPVQLNLLSQLLTSPSVERLARDARDERALTERYAELAEALDDPNVSAAERERRHAEFAHLRKRLRGQIVQSAQASGGDRTVLGATISRLYVVLESASQVKPPKKGRAPDYAPLLARLRELGAGKAKAP
jgi:hypothetical protein